MYKIEYEFLNFFFWIPTDTQPSMAPNRAEPLDFGYHDALDTLGMKKVEGSVCEAASVIL